MENDTSKQLDILIVDDIFINRMMLADILAGLGCRTTEAKNGEEALRLSQERSFDMILMDLEMPVMNGIETTVAIRALGGRNAIVPIIALTAHSADEIAADLSAARFTDLLGKPFLSAKIQRLLEIYC